MRYLTFFALSLAAAGVQADLLTQEFTIESYSLNHQGTEFTYLDSSEYLSPMTFTLNYDLSNTNGDFLSRVDIDDPDFRYVSTGTYLDSSAVSVNIDSVILDALFGFHGDTATTKTELYFTDILFDYKPDGRVDMEENGSRLSFSTVTYEDKVITGDVDSGIYVESQKIYSTYFSLSAHEFLYELDSADPVSATMETFTDFLANYPVYFSFGTETYTEFYEYENGVPKTYGEPGWDNITDYSRIGGNGQAELTNQVRTDAVSVDAPGTFSLLSLAFLALGYRRYHRNA